MYNKLLSVAHTPASFCVFKNKPPSSGLPFAHIWTSLKHRSYAGPGANSELCRCDWLLIKDLHRALICTLNAATPWCQFSGVPEARGVIQASLPPQNKT